MDLSALKDYKHTAKILGWGHDRVNLNPEKKALLDKHVEGKIIDIGCGSGIYTNYLYKRGHYIVGVDKEPSFIAKNKKLYPQITFKLANAYKLPFQDNSFDVALMLDLLEHLDDLKALKEAKRIAKKIIISVPHTNQEILTKYSLVHHHYLDRTHQRTYTSKSLEQKIKKAGLTVVFIKPSLPISLSGLFIEHLSRNRYWKKILLKTWLKVFLPEPPIYSSIFAVAKK